MVPSANVKLDSPQYRQFLDPIFSSAPSGRSDQAKWLRFPFELPRAEHFLCPAARRRSDSRKFAASSVNGSCRATNCVTCSRVIGVKAGEEYVLFDSEVRSMISCNLSWRTVCHAKVLLNAHDETCYECRTSLGNSLY
jgi:hypothetical protein